jgi:alkyl sulfatase BDS1-like metallo-beta-lactamase superfamily hydrolase
VDVWFGHLGGSAAWLAEQHAGALLAQDAPVPDLTFDRRLALRIGDLDVECISTPGGETVDACVVWLPQHRICFISNLVGPMFPHFPNFNTLRGDKYRFVEPYLASVRTVRALQPEVLVTGRNEPIRGTALIDACLGRLHDAVDYVHRATLEGINAGADIFTLMREIRLPDHLRVGQEYGRVSWAVRTIWESYLGWFHLHSTTELYPVHSRDAFATVVDLVGPDAIVARAREQLDAGEPVIALHLVEAVMAAEPDHIGARDTAIAAHERLLADGGDANFWAGGWLRYQVERLRGDMTD